VFGYEGYGMPLSLPIPRGVLSQADHGIVADADNWMSEARARGCRGPRLKDRRYNPPAFRSGSIAVL
jgi:hypothetical protein